MAPLHPALPMFPNYHLCLLAALLTAASTTSAAVKISQEKHRPVLSNDSLQITINPDNGDFSLQAEGRIQVERGYWSQVGRRQDGRDIARLGVAAAPVITVDPAQHGGTRGEIALRFAPAGREGGLPCEVEMRYTLAADARTLYLSAVWRHGQGMAGFNVAEARHAMKLDRHIFDYLAVDEKRHGLMPSGADWDRATPLNLKEARRIVTGPFAGKAEHKYGYSALIAETPAWGWASSSRQCGVWLLNPSAEYLAGGPTKMELTGHLDVNREGTPVLLNMWHGSHYGGSALSIAENEVWTKVVGPFAIHCNAGQAPEALWREAQETGRREQAAWPYDWLDLPEFPRKDQRGTAEGTLLIRNPATSPGHIRIGLAAPPRLATRLGRTDSVDWQRNSRDYQFWGTVGPDGRFALPQVRPGTYTLYAIADGVPGEFSQTGFVVHAGQNLDCGTLTWEPERGRQTLWQIGVADRSAGEFRRGNEAGAWGLYYQFPGDFPQGVNYTIGQSDWTKDWNYAHCGISQEGRRGVDTAAWRVNFELAEMPAAKLNLRLGIAGNRSPEGVKLAVNGRPAGGTGPMPDTAVMHRDAVRGAWFERSIPIPAGLLQAGQNTLTLRVPVQSWPEGVLYDFVRLEAAEQDSGHGQQTVPPDELPQ